MHASASADTQIIDMKLLTSKIGWAATEKTLCWTTNAGSTWHNITPMSVKDGKIASVFFLNVNQGWILYSGVGGKRREFNVAYTNDGGTNWSINSVNLPTMFQKNNEESSAGLTGDGLIDFADNIYGWINLRFFVSPAMGSDSTLFRTEDGGKTWKWLKTDLPMANHFHFMTPKNGWLASETDLYATHDGGNSWQQVSLNASQPPYFDNEESGDYYDLPIFQNSRQGFLPVTYLRDLYVSTLVLFATNNGGSTWKADRIMPDLKNIAYMYPSALADSILISLVPSETEHSLTLIKVLPNGKTITTTANALNIKGNLTKGSLYPSKWWKLSFITPDQGWVSTNTNQLLLTNDGGKTWTVITPQ